jgi:hypothetical protein
MTDKTDWIKEFSEFIDVDAPLEFVDMNSYVDEIVSRHTRGDGSIDKAGIEAEVDEIVAQLRMTPDQRLQKRLDAWRHAKEANR